MAEKTIRILVLCQKNEARSQLLSLYLAKALNEGVTHAKLPLKFMVESAGVEATKKGPISLKLKAIQQGQNLMANVMNEMRTTEPELFQLLAKQYDPTKLAKQRGGLHEIPEIANAIAKPVTAEMVRSAILIIPVSVEVREALERKFSQTGNAGILLKGKVKALPEMLRFGGKGTEIGNPFGITKPMRPHYEETQRARRIANRLARMLIKQNVAKPKITRAPQTRAYSFGNAKLRRRLLR